MFTFFLIILILVSIALAVAVLLQAGTGGGLAAMGGGASTDSFLGGRQAATILTKSTWWLGGVAGGIFAVVGQLGDLCMSLFKRGAGVKDSSHLLPGLGGVMDVLDSPLMVAPIAYWLLSAFASSAA